MKLKVKYTLKVSSIVPGLVTRNMVEFVDIHDLDFPMTDILAYYVDMRLASHLTLLDTEIMYPAAFVTRLGEVIWKSGKHKSEDGTPRYVPNPKSPNNTYGLKSFADGEYTPVYNKKEAQKISEQIKQSQN